MVDFGELKKWIEEEKASITSLIVKLTHDDAPKNKFSIVAGRLRAFEEMEAKLVSMARDRESGQ